MEYEKGDLLMEELLMILKEMDDSVDWEKETAVIDDRLLDSFGVISLVAELEDHFDVEIEAAEIVPENFNSAAAMYQMITRLQER